MAQVASDDGPVPDFTARYTTKGDWGHFGIAALVRQLRYQNGPLDQDDASTGYGLSVSGKFNLGKSDDIRYMLTAGSGIGRYVGLALNNDAVLDANGDLENIDLISGFVGWRHVFTPKLRGNLFYSRAQYDNDTDLTGLGITEGAQSAHVNLIYTPLPKLDLGAELIWGQRELESGDRRRPRSPADARQIQLLRKTTMSTITANARDAAAHPGAQEGHLRVQPGHRVRVVRLLPVRLARGDHRQAVLQRRQRDQRLHLRAAGVRRRLRGAAVRRARSSAASAT